MPSQKTIQELKEKLLGEKDRLEKDLTPIANKSDGDYQAKTEDLGRTEEDNAEEVENYVDNLSVTETLEARLSEVNDALVRIEEGVYGNCEECSSELPIERLEANPAAATCVKCSN